MDYDVGYDYEVGADDDEESALEMLGVSGDDDDDEEYDDEEVGWSKKPKRGRRIPMKTLSAWKKAFDDRKKSSQRGRIRDAALAGRLPTILLGCDSADNGGDIAAAATRDLEAETTVNMRITDMFIDDTVAGDFLIDRLEIASTNIVKNAQALPASMFTGGVRRAPLETPVIPAGTPVVLTVINRSGAARRLVAGFVGVKL